MSLKKQNHRNFFWENRNCIWRLEIVFPPYFDIDNNFFQLDLRWSVSNVGRSTPSSHQTDWKLGVWWDGPVSGNLSLGSLVLLGKGFHDRFHLHGKDRIGVPPSWFGITKGAFLETLSLKLVSLAHWHHWGKYSWGISLVNEGFWSTPKTWRPEESYRFRLKPETQGEDQWSTTTQPFLLWLTMHYTSNTMVCSFRSCKARCSIGKALPSH